MDFMVIVTGISGKYPVNIYDKTSNNFKKFSDFYICFEKCFHDYLIFVHLNSNYKFLSFTIFCFKYQTHFIDFFYIFNVKV